MAPLPEESRGVDPCFQYTRKINRFSGEYRPGDAHNPEFRQRVVQEYQVRASETGESRPHGLMSEIAKDYKVDPATVKR
jgi:transposase-like protein